MPRRLVIFDLDETLVHATNRRLPFEPDFEVAPYFVYQRLYVHELLSFAAERFDLAVWSSSSTEYVAAVTARLFGTTYPLKFAWSVERCVQREDPRTNSYVYIKDLRKVQSQGYAVERITIVDDSHEKVKRQPRNHLHVKPFTGDRGDAELLAIKAALEALSAKHA
jgi:RNA polymerase II subunit A small phosphatase-like protein